MDTDPLLPVLHELDMRVLALNVEPTTEAIAQVVFNWLARSKGYAVVRVTVYETDKYSATCTDEKDVMIVSALINVS